MMASALAQLLGLVQVMRRVEDRGALVDDLAHQSQDVQPRLRVDADGGLVEEQHARAVHEPAGQVEPPLHAARVVLDGALGVIAEVDGLEQLVHPRARRRAAQPVEAAEELEVFARR